MCYDNLGSLFLINLVWSLLNLPYMIMAYAIWQIGLNFGDTFVWAGALLGINLVFFSPPIVIIHHSCSRWVRGSECTILSSLGILRKYFWRLQLLQIVNLLITLILIMNIVFYIEWSTSIGLLLTGLMIWALLIFFIFSLHLHPFLVTQDTTVLSTLKIIAILSVSHPLNMSWNFCAFVFFGFLSFISGVGLFLGIHAAWVLWVSFRCQDLLSSYTGSSIDPETSRSFRELIRPWET